MSFTRVNPPGFAVGDVLTSAQMNSLDIDHANALDKTSAGDTLNGVVTISGSGQIVVTTSQGIKATTGSIVSTGAGGIGTTAVTGITTSVANGIGPGIAGGISDGGFAGGIRAITAGGIQSSVVGGIQLAGGATDWVSFSATRGHAMSFSPKPQGTVDGTNWSMPSSGSGLPQLTSLTTTAQPILLELPLHDGGTLFQIAVYFIVGNTHTSAPATPPTIDIRRATIASFGGSTVSLFSTGPQPFFSAGSPPSGATWYNGGLIQAFAPTANQNNVINRSTYVYFMVLTDEAGTGSHTSNDYVGFQVSYTGIPNMMFP